MPEPTSFYHWVFCLCNIYIYIYIYKNKRKQQVRKAASSKTPLTHACVPQIWRTINLPLDPGAGAAVTKPEAQALLHAVEELYFFRRYGEGAAFVRRVLNGDGAAPGLDEDTRKMLRYYETRCVQRQREAEGEGGRRDGI